MDLIYANDSHVNIAVKYYPPSLIYNLKEVILVTKKSVIWPFFPVYLPVIIYLKYSYMISHIRMLQLRRIANIQYYQQILATSFLPSPVLIFGSSDQKNCCSLISVQSLIYNFFSGIFLMSAIACERMHTMFDKLAVGPKPLPPPPS